MYARCHPPATCPNCRVLSICWLGAALIMLREDGQVSHLSLPCWTPDDASLISSEDTDPHRIGTFAPLSFLTGAGASLLAALPDRLLVIGQGMGSKARGRRGKVGALAGLRREKPVRLYTRPLLPLEPLVLGIAALLSHSRCPGPDPTMPSLSSSPAAAAVLANRGKVLELLVAAVVAQAPPALASTDNVAGEGLGIHAGATSSTFFVLRSLASAAAAASIGQKAGGKGPGAAANGLGAAKQVRRPSFEADPGGVSGLSGLGGDAGSDPAQESRLLLSLALTVGGVLSPDGGLQGTGESFPRRPWLSAADRAGAAIAAGRWDQGLVELLSRDPDLQATAKEDGFPRGEGGLPTTYSTTAALLRCFAAHAAEAGAVQTAVRAYDLAGADAAMARLLLAHDPAAAAAIAANGSHATSQALAYDLPASTLEPAQALDPADDPGEDLSSPALNSREQQAAIFRDLFGVDPPPAPRAGSGVGAGAGAPAVNREVVKALGESLSEASRSGAAAAPAAARGRKGARPPPASALEVALAFLQRSGDEVGGLWPRDQTNGGATKGGPEGPGTTHDVIGEALALTGQRTALGTPVRRAGLLMTDSMQGGGDGKGGLAPWWPQNGLPPSSSQASRCLSLSNTLMRVERQRSRACCLHLGTCSMRIVATVLSAKKMAASQRQGLLQTRSQAHSPPISTVLRS